MPMTVLIYDKLSITACWYVSDIAIAELITKISKSRIVTDYQYFRYRFINTPKPPEYVITIKAIQFLIRLPHNIRFRYTTTDELNGRLRPDCRTAKYVIKTATGIIYMLRHEETGTNTEFAQWPIDVCKRAILPTRFCMPYQMYLFH